MKFLLALALAATAVAQAPANAPNPLLSAKDTLDTATRLLQLMESTGVAVNGLLPATEILRQNAAKSGDALRRSNRSVPVTYQFLNHLKAFLAVTETFPRPTPFPQIAAAQLDEFREGTNRFQRHFDALVISAAATTAAQASDPNTYKRYADANTKLLPPVAKTPRVVFLGDSITDSWRLNEYFPGRDFVNRGISGQTTLQMLGRFLTDVVNLHPRAVLILGGVNDIARGISPANIEDNLAMIGSLAKANGIKPLFASILPVSDYHKDTNPAYDVVTARSPVNIRAVNEWLRQYCQREGFTYVDYYTAIADTNGMLPADQGDDGLHPNAKGYRVMAPVAQDAIDRSLVALPAAPESQKRRFGLIPGNK